MRSEILSAPRPAAWKRFVLPSLVAIAAVLPYLGVLDAEYVFDDVKLVKENEFLRSGKIDLGLIAETFDITSHRWDRDELRLNYRPLRFLSYLVDARLSELFFGPFPASGPPVFFFHLTNVLLHALNAVLVLIVSRRLGRWLFRGSTNREALCGFFAISAGLLFALHPIQTEAVTYISGRRDVLSALFFLGAVAIHLGAGPEEPPGLLAMIGVPVLFGLGLLAKESVVTLLGALLLLDLVRRARWGARRVALHGTLFTIAAGFAWVTLANGSLISAPQASTAGSTSLTACRYVVRYLGLSLAPLSQSVDYSFDAIVPSTSLLAPWTTLPAALFCLSALIAASWLLLRRPRGAAASPLLVLLPLGLFWFVGTLVPVLQFVPIAEKFAERFTYIPVVGVFLVLATAATRLFEREPFFGVGAAGLAAVVMFAATVRRNGDWETPLALWTAAAEAQPRAARAHLGRANALKEAGQLRDAREEYSTALSIFEEKPDVPLHHGFILQALTFRGHVEGQLSGEDAAFLGPAIDDYRRVLGLSDVDGVAIESSPGHVVLHFELGALLLAKGERESAAKEFRRVVDLLGSAPLAGAAHYHLAKIAAASGDVDAAVASFREACEAIPRADPSRPKVFIELADLLIERKSLDDASRVVGEALSSGITGSMKLNLLMREAKILDRKGDLKDCVATLERILAEDPAYGPALMTLGGIEAAQSRFDRAEVRYRGVLAREPSNPEALEGLQNVKLLRRIAEGKTGTQGADVDPTALLEAMEKKGLEAIAKGELLAARDIFSKMLVRATDAKKTQSQLLALRAIARVEESLGHYKKSEEHLKTALELDPRDTRSLHQIGDLVLRRLDDRASARNYYERCVEAGRKGEPADPLVHFNLAELIGASDPLVALSHLDEARKAGYTEPALDRAMGYRYADAGRWKDSLDAFNRYFERTTVFEAVGREDTTRKAAKEFVRQNVLPHVGE